MNKAASGAFLVLGALSLAGGVALDAPGRPALGIGVVADGALTFGLALLVRRRHGRGSARGLLLFAAVGLVAGLVASPIGLILAVMAVVAGVRVVRATTKLPSFDVVVSDPEAQAGRDAWAAEQLEQAALAVMVPTQDSAHRAR